MRQPFDDDGLASINGPADRLQHMLLADFDPVVIVDLNGKIEAMNLAARCLLLNCEGNARGRHFGDFIASDYCRAYLNCLSSDLAPNGNLDDAPVRPVLARRLNGPVFPANLRIVQFQQGGESFFVAHIKDLSSATSARRPF